MLFIVWMNLLNTSKIKVNKKKKLIEINLTNTNLTDVCYISKTKLYM